MHARIALGFVAFALAAPPVLAGTGASYVLSKDKRTTTATQPALRNFPLPFRLRTEVLKSNLAFKYPDGTYYCCSGATISGPNSPVGVTKWMAVSFVADKDAVVKGIAVGTGWAAGTHDVVIGLYDDDGGVPAAKSLGSAHAVESLTADECCELTEFKSKAGIPVVAGKTYWVALTTDGANSDNFTVWNYNSSDQVHPASIAVSDGNSWTNTGPSIPVPSFAVLIKNQKQ